MKLPCALVMVAVLGACRLPVNGAHGRPVGSGAAGGPIASGSTEILGTIEVDGDRAYLNHQPARSGDLVRDGDTLSTGHGSSILVRLDRATVQLDEDTDPQLLRDGLCVVIRLFTGRAIVEAKGGFCVKTSDGVEVNLSSVLHIEAAEGRSTLTLIEGHAVVVDRRPEVRAAGRRPQPLALARYDELVVRPGPLQQRVVAAPAAAALRTWTARFRFAVRSDRVQPVPVRPPAAPGEPPRRPLLQQHPQPAAPGRGRGGSPTPAGSTSRAAAVPVERVVPAGGVPDRRGWCCLRGALEPVDREACAGRGGSYYEDVRIARDRCR